MDRTPNAVGGADLGSRQILMPQEIDEPWRREPASEAQLRKLRFYGQNVARGITKGDASELIDDAMSRHPEKEDAYQRWKQTEEELTEWYDEAVMSDFCEEGHMKKPTRKMIQETIAFLESNRPHWRDEVRGNAFAILLMERYPDIETRRRT
jgi:hypothetical protein